MEDAWAKDFSPLYREDHKRATKQVHCARDASQKQMHYIDVTSAHFPNQMEVFMARFFNSYEFLAVASVGTLLICCGVVGGIF